MTTSDFATLSTRLIAALKPVASPIAISFHSPGSAPVATRPEPKYPEPNDHGRTGQVPAGCVFWIQGTEKTFSTEAADHGNCSVGSYTHGFITLEEAATKDDVGAVLEDEHGARPLGRLVEFPPGDRDLAGRPGSAFVWANPPSARAQREFRTPAPHWSFAPMLFFFVLS